MCKRFNKMPKCFKPVFIVSCTRKKIWDFDKNAPDKVPAKDAYKGSTFLKFLDLLNTIDSVDWFVFSSKYGIIEPEHPIENYDIHFIKDRDKAISEEQLIKQIKGHNIDKVENVYFVGSSDEYYEKLKRIFKKVNVRLSRFKISNDI